MSLLQNVILTGAEDYPQLKLRSLVYLEANPLTNQQILLIIQLNVVIAVQHIPRTNALLIESPVSNVIGLVIMPRCADPAIPVLPKIQGNLPGFVVEADHPVVEDSLLEDKSTKQQRSLKPNLMRNLS